MVTRQHSTKLQRHQLYRGVYARVARQLGVDRSFVSRVASGERTSARVTTALEREINRIDKLVKGSR